ncbi:peptidoglycan/xylan/chitin deacetylase (PgdA/CDA1 family) [Desulfobaculum xiamenense]|uniref:Peptidoglycan/xylan/chitin deacetylase (PgdA/CDA1 family) n=1 Tax=Desulfobaculum xiamenense TaxID=995050 RepID=A0A846QK14_9BACT|nr:polysaccharide deacetylase family protein [Desulfobaculum xiamenense]NJB66822.1 peptidoglycan/xylan/chitin deacetylase (PgdA/CDA1 family) [Desulfobaculum xiamenense]
MRWSRPLLGRSSVPVLCYHNMGGNGMPWQSFTRQIRWLRDSGVRTLSLTELDAFLGGEPLCAPSVLLTFDDGFRDLHTRVAPLFEELGLRGTVFVINNRIRPEDEPGTNEDIIAHEAHRAFLTEGNRSAWLSESELTDLVKRDLFDVGSHSGTHVMGIVSPHERPEKPEHWAYARWHAGLEQGELPRMAPEFTTHLFNAEAGRPETDGEFFARVRDNLAASRSDLERRLGKAVTSLGWPWGKAHPIAVDAAKAAGLRTLFTLANGPVTAGSDPAAINRLEVRRGKGPSWFTSRTIIYSHATIAALYAGMRIG